ncbi:hypothetical protein HPB47_026348 [Ixodes persulcatus]|uniref:Uncharacterized protein n=1 Tax=Ixodes persulcatus TaxID=34615 RepID=A0AC60PZL2_IXOPE|nr:hypothetical protein HPB47_026348 [Ixodes persulcatus]
MLKHVVQPASCSCQGLWHVARTIAACVALASAIAVCFFAMNGLQGFETTTGVSTTATTEDDQPLLQYPSMARQAPLQARQDLELLRGVEAENVTSTVEVATAAVPLQREMSQTLALSPLAGFFVAWLVAPSSYCGSHDTPLSLKAPSTYWLRRLGASPESARAGFAGFAASGFVLPAAAPQRRHGPKVSASTEVQSLRETLRKATGLLLRRTPLHVISGSAASAVPQGPEQIPIHQPLQTHVNRRWWFFLNGTCSQWDFPDGDCVSARLSAFETAQDCRQGCLEHSHSLCGVVPVAERCSEDQLRFPAYSWRYQDGHIGCRLVDPVEPRCLQGPNNFRTQSDCRAACLAS